MPDRWAFDLEVHNCFAVADALSLMRASTEHVTGRRVKREDREAAQGRSAQRQCLNIVDNERTDLIFE